MPDQKPPRTSGDERRTIQALLAYQRESFVRKVSGTSEKDAAWSPVSSGTSLLWLANHMADAETTWVLRRFARRDDLRSPHSDTIGGAVDRYRTVCADVDRVVAGSSLDEACPSFDDEEAVDLRWVLTHLLEETARHAGHADVIREMIDGSTGR